MALDEPKPSNVHDHDHHDEDEHAYYVPGLPEGEPVVYANHAEAYAALEKSLMPYRTNDPIAGTCVLAKATPGVGKTKVALHMAAMKCVDNKRGMWAAPTRNIAWQAHDRLKSDEYGTKVLMLEGRHNGYVAVRTDKYGVETEQEVLPNCVRYDRIALARKRGYPARTYVCNGCPHCPTFRNSKGEKPLSDQWCRYFKVLYEANNLPNGEKQSTFSGYISSEEAQSIKNSKMEKIIVTTHHMAAAMIADGEMLSPDWVIFDEDPISALRETYVWNEDELDRDIDGDNFIVFRALLKRTIYLAKKHLAEPLDTPDDKKVRVQLRYSVHQATEYGHTTLWGKDMARFMVIAARQLNVDLKTVLETTANTMPPVNPGQLSYMPNDEVERLPHYKEVDLAGELLRVLEAAEDQKETAYKVSLRNEPGKGWAFVWDHVRRISYEGPLFFLDAYGSPEIVKRYTNREVTLIDVKCQVRDNVTVRLYPEVSTNRSDMDEAGERECIFDDWLLPELRKHNGKRVLIYTQKRYVSWLEQKIADEEDTLDFASINFKWFWQDRGDDSFGDFDTVIVFGTPIPNVIAERQFANALYAGEEPLSWKTNGKNEYLDVRAAEHTKARQQNELLQCVYRVRPALPNSKPQAIVIFSRMKLPVEFELKGAKQEKMHDRHDEKSRYAIGIWHMYRDLGCYADAFAPFIGVDKHFVEWARGERDDFPMDYETMCRRHNRVLRTRSYRNGRTFAMKYFCNPRPNEPVPVRQTLYRGKVLNFFGNEETVHKILDRMFEATREPGVDNESVEDQGRAGPEPGSWQQYLPLAAWRKGLVIENVIRSLQGELFFSGKWRPDEWLPTEVQYLIDDLHMEHPCLIGVHRMLSMKCYFEEKGFTNVPDPLEDQVKFWAFIRGHMDIYYEIMEKTKGMTEAKTIDEFVVEEDPDPGDGGDKKAPVPKNVYDIGIGTAEVSVGGQDEVKSTSSEGGQVGLVIPLIVSSPSSGSDGVSEGGGSVGDEEDPSAEPSGGSSGPDGGPASGPGPPDEDTS
jgi:hypothetical protein